MTKAEFNSYRFDSINDPSDAQLGQLMEYAAEKVRKSNRECEEKFFAELRKECEDAKKRGLSHSN